MTSFILNYVNDNNILGSNKYTLQHCGIPECTEELRRSLPEVQVVAQIPATKGLWIIPLPKKQSRNPWSALKG